MLVPQCVHGGGKLGELGHKCQNILEKSNKGRHLFATGGGLDDLDGIHVLLAVANPLNRRIMSKAEVDCALEQEGLLRFQLDARVGLQHLNPGRASACFWSGCAPEYCPGRLKLERPGAIL